VSILHAPRFVEVSLFNPPDLCWWPEPHDVVKVAVPAGQRTCTLPQPLSPPTSPKTLMSFSHIMFRTNMCSSSLRTFLHQSQSASRLAVCPTSSIRLFGTFGKRESRHKLQTLDKPLFAFPISKGFTPIFASFKRGVVTDSQAIVSRPTGRDAWIRYAVAGVSFASLCLLRLPV
jgi:hypothetical protein